MGSFSRPLIYLPPTPTFSVAERALISSWKACLKVCKVSTCPLFPPPPTGSFSRPSIYLLPTLLSVLLKELSQAHGELIWRYCMEQLALHDSECWWETIQVQRTTKPSVWIWTVWIIYIHYAHWAHNLKTFHVVFAGAQKDYWVVYEATGVWEGNNIINPELTAFSDSADGVPLQQGWRAWGCILNVWHSAIHTWTRCPTGACFNSRSEAETC